VWQLVTDTLAFLKHTLIALAYLYLLMVVSADGRGQGSPRAKGMLSGRHAPVAKGPKGAGAGRGKHFEDDEEDGEPPGGGWR
jgi:hypothetical protein